MERDEERGRKMEGEMQEKWKETEWEIERDEED